MTTQPTELSAPQTLFDCVKDNQEAWERLVLEGVSKSLTELGEAVYSIEWANKYRTAVLNGK